MYNPSRDFGEFVQKLFFAVEEEEEEEEIAGQGE